MARGRAAGHGLKCPNCGSARLFVTDTKAMEDYIRRRRRCEKCRYVMVSHEVVDKVGDPVGTRVSDILQLRQHMMTLSEGQRVAVRMLLTRLAEERAPRVASESEQTHAAPPDDIPS